MRISVSLMKMFKFYLLFFRKKKHDCQCFDEFFFSNQSDASLFSSMNYSLFCKQQAAFNECHKQIKLISWRKKRIQSGTVAIYSELFQAVSMLISSYYFL